MVIVNTYDAKSHVSQLVRRTLDGARIVIARAGKPLVELLPYQEQKRRTGGIWKRKVQMAYDFDQPLTELEQEIYDDEQ